MLSFQLSELTLVLPKIASVILVLFLLVLAIQLFLKLYSFKRLVYQDVIYLELTPPVNSDKTPEATKQLFAALHGLGMSRRWVDKLLKRESVFALEVASTRQEGIRYIIRVAQDKADAFEQLITAYMPAVMVKQTSGYFKSELSKKARTLEFKQAKHFAYPLQVKDSLKEHDPIAYITNAMTKLSGSELMSLQLVITPVRLTEAEDLNQKILINEDLAPKLNSGHKLISRLSTGVNKFTFGLIDAVSGSYLSNPKTDFYTANRELEYKKQVAKRVKPVRTLSYFEHELVDSIHHKLSQPLFKVKVRVLLVCDSKVELSKRKRSLESAFSLFSDSKYQNLKASRVIRSWRGRYQRFAFSFRLPSFFRPTNVLAASEIADLYHFPNPTATKTENIVKSLSKTLPAPVSLKNGSKLDILLGENEYHGSITPIGLTQAERERHIYIIGGTGNGKTTMLLYGIVQDIKNGKGVAVLDPHGDLSETILRHIPESRIKDVIYLNPDDISYPIGLNLLELPEGLTGDALLREKDLVTEATISVMRKIFSEDDSGGHRIEYVLRNTIQTALKLDNPTLFTIFDLLNDKEFRKAAIQKLDDKDLINFWKNELGKAGEFQRVKMSAGITSKIGRFLFSASAKRILEQPKSTIDFDDILNSSKILICNFSKGLLGEDTSTLFGTTVLAKLQTAALRRARLSQNDRRPFYLYVDEFQNFATMSFVQMLSEARKYQLFLTMAEQSTSQQDQQRLVDIILANVGTVICFRSGSPADERLVLPLFKPYVEEGEIANLPSFQFYMRIAALQAQEPLSGITVLLDNEGSSKLADQVKTTSRYLYGVVYKNTQRAEPSATTPTPQRKNQTVKRKPASLGSPLKSTVKSSSRA